MGNSYVKLMQTSKNPLRIAFFHNMYIKYRLPLFQKLSRIFNITYFFGEVDSKTPVQNRIFNFKVLKSVPFVKTNLYYSTLSPTLFFHLLKGKYDLFIGCGMGQISTHIVFLVSRLARKPFIVCEEVWYWPRTFLRMLVWPLVNVMLAKSNAIVVFGSKSRELLISLRADPNKIFVAPNASICVLNKSIAVKKEEMKERLGIQNKKIILYLGRLVRVKGLSHLIKAFARLQEEIPDSFLLIAGEGETMKKLEKLHLTHKINCIFLPATYNETQKALYYSLADIVVLPSARTRHEAEVWGLVLNEAMSVGKPVIATTAVGAAYDLIENGINGYVVNQGDAEALYNALQKMLSNSKKLKKMGAKCREKINERFTYSHMAQGFVAAVQHATERAH